MAQILEEGTLNENNELVIDGKAISCVYYRAGYSPNDYYTEVNFCLILFFPFQLFNVV